MQQQRLIAATMIGPMLWLGIGWRPPAGDAGCVRYDADGIRWQKIVGAQVITYLVDRNQPFEQVLEERDGAGAVTASYVYLDDLVAAAFAGVGTRFYGYDGQMSTRFLTDSAAQVTDSYTFDAWGVTLSSAGGTPNNYLYTGEQFDPNIGFQYNRARYLSNSTGRWLSHDPFSGFESDPASLHRYSYASNDPSNGRDPSGLFTLVELLVVIVIVALIVAVVTSLIRGALLASARRNSLSDPVVAAAIKSAYDNTTITGKEQGGFILRDANGVLSVQAFPAGSETIIDVLDSFNGPGELLALFHTHATQEGFGVGDRERFPGGPAQVNGEFYEFVIGPKQVWLMRGFALHPVEEEVKVADVEDLGITPRTQ